MNILTLNLVFSTFVFWIAARHYVLPNLGRWNAHALLLPILLRAQSWPDSRAGWSARSTSLAA